MKKRRHRRTIEEQIEDLEAELAVLQERVDKRHKYSPEWIARHRERLRLSAADFGDLIGVTALTVYNWEKGKTAPRARQLGLLESVRDLDWREAWKRLEDAGY